MNIGREQLRFLGMQPHIVRHVYEVGLFGRKLCYYRQCHIEGLVRNMLGLAQGVDDEQVEPFELLNGFVGHGKAVGDVCHVANAVANAPAS